MEEFFAVGTSFFEETILGHNDGADHAGAEVALLAWGNEVVGHVEGLCGVEKLEMISKRSLSYASIRA